MLFNKGKIKLLVRTQINAGAWKQTQGPRLNAPGIYFKIGLVDPAFIRGRRLIGVRRLIEKIRYEDPFKASLTISFLFVRLILTVRLGFAKHVKGLSSVPRMRLCNSDEINQILTDCETLFTGTNTLIILDDCASSHDVKQRSNKFISQAFSGRHQALSVWVLTQQVSQ